MARAHTPMASTHQNLTTSVFNQTLVHSLQNPPSMSLIHSLRSAYGVFRPHEEDISDESSESGRRLITTALAEEGEEDGERSENWPRRRRDLPSERSIYDNADRATGTFIAGWNTSSIVQGVGLLAIPYACLQAGWLAIPTLILVTLITCYTGHLIGDCLYEDKGIGRRIAGRRLSAPRTRVRSTLSCIARDCLPCGGNRLISLLILLDMFGVCVLYLILVGDCTQALIGPLVAPTWTRDYWTALMGFCAIFLILYPRLEVIAWFSVIATIGIYVCAVLGITYCLVSLYMMEQPRLYLPSPNLSKLPIALTIFVFSFCGHAALPGIEGSMREPQQYGRMLNWSFGLSGVTKCIFGVIICCTIGEKVDESVTENMKDWHSFYLAMNSAVVVTMFFLIPLFFYILGEQLDSSIVRLVKKGYMRPKKLFSWYTMWFLSTRLSVCCMILLVAIMVPKFAVLMSFLGSISGSTLALISPPLFHWYLFSSRLGFARKLLHLLIALFGVIIGVFGLYSSSKELVGDG